jgi:multiple sugar transport system ATP-binding protein
VKGEIKVKALRRLASCAVAVGLVVTSGCAGAGSLGASANEVTIALVSNSQMTDAQKPSPHRTRRTEAMATITYRNASCIYAQAETLAVDSLNLDIEDGEFVVLVGPSGSGKSTALRMLAGLEDIDEGSIEIGGKDMTGVASKDRDIAMVFQNYALYPNKTVAENMGFALKLRGVSADERRKKVEEAAKVLDLTEYLDRKPAKLSGGQRQRVAMGRAIVRDPQVFCMDEPLSNLDAKLRV